jgi:hypothetical protein
LVGKNGVAIMDHDTVWVIGWNGFSELLLRRGMGCDMNVNESTAGVFNHHKHV